jgi:hypothetical protein
LNQRGKELIHSFKVKHLWIKKATGKSLLEDKDNLIVIDKRFDKLLTALRTAVANEYKLDKEATSFHDILDAFRLSLQLYQRSNK